jgi:hypothetical protein
MPKRWQDWMNLTLGVYLIISPFLFAYADGYGGVSAWNSYLVGAALVVVTALASAKPQAWQEWVVLLLGIWLILAPFVLGFSGDGAAAWNQILTGVVVTIAAATGVRSALRAANR